MLPRPTPGGRGQPANLVARGHRSNPVRGRSSGGQRRQVLLEVAGLTDAVHHDQRTTPSASTRNEPRTRTRRLIEHPVRPGDPAVRPVVGQQVEARPSASAYARRVNIASQEIATTRTPSSSKRPTVAEPRSSPVQMS